MNEKYWKYLHSEKWKVKAQHIKQERNFTCELCGNHILLEVVTILAKSNHSSWYIPEISRFAESIFERIGDRNKLIEIHHKTYKHIFNESNDELACLCRPCHVFCSENAVRNREDEAWQKTQDQVQKLLKKINNNPNGEKEFELISKSIALGSLVQHGYEEFSNIFMTKQDIEYDEFADEYYSFIKDYFVMQDGFE